MANPDRLRSPLDHLFSFIGKSHEEPLKNALYSATTLIFVSIGCAAAVAVYFILEPFFKPLLWAVLVGSILHPFKHQLTLNARNWLNRLHSSGTPLVLAALFLPAIAVDRSSEWLGRQLLKYLKLLCAGLVTVALAYVLYQYFPLDFLVAVFDFAYVIMEKLTEGFISTLVTAFLVSSSCFVAVKSSSTKQAVLSFVSYFMWTLIIVSVVSLADSFKCLVILLFLVTVFAGYLVDRGLVKTSGESTVDGVETRTDVTLQVGSPSNMEDVTATVTECKEEAGGTPIVEEKIKVVMTPRKPIPRLNLISPTPSAHANTGNRYIYGTLWACAVIFLWRYMWLLHLFPIPLVYFIVKSLGSFVGLWTFLQKKIRAFYKFALVWYRENDDLIVPKPFKLVVLALSRLDKTVIERLEKQVDVLVSAVIIGVVVTLAILGSLFVGVQVYSESVHLIRFTTDLANQTISRYPEVKQWMPGTFNQVVDSVVDNAYSYGRTGIVTLVRGAIQEKDPVRAAQMEQSIMEIVDRIQNAWATSGKSPTKKDARDTSIQTVLDGLRKTPDNSKQTGVNRKPPLLRRLSQDLLNVSALVSFARENVGMLMSILESIWTILKGNIHLLFNATTAILSLVFGGGTAILNFVVNRVIFLTALYYLLVASGPQYKPVQLVAALSPGAGTTFGNAVEDAINTVFLASFKKAAFYGLWTWLVHTVFQVNFVFIPSALAAVLGAAPFLGTYWAAVPAALELWLAQGRGIEAILLMVCHFVPTLIVDDAFYAEIKGGGHPYLTGLAVAGGIFWLGVEGAIIGPLLLCMLLVAVTVYSSLMREPSVMEINSRWTQRRLNRTDTVG